MAEANLHLAARGCLMEPDPDRKIASTRDTAGAWREGTLSPGSAPDPVPVPEPGRPPLPRLVAPRQLADRSLKGERGRAALIHAVTHIEFNAVNLAWDAVYRFRGLPRDYYGDWVRVADEESRHFQALRGRLRDLGYEYGDFPAHNGLWEMAVRTDHDLAARMALVPRVLEARGLDVTPGMMQRLRRSGDPATAEILEVVLREEVGHVAAGTRWFHYACARRGREPEALFFSLLGEYLRGDIRCPLHREARVQAGFSENELRRLEAMCR